MQGELMAVVGMANETNALAAGYTVAIDAAFTDGGSVGARPGTRRRRAENLRLTPTVSPDSLPV